MQKRAIVMVLLFTLILTACNEEKAQPLENGEESSDHVDNVEAASIQTDGSVVIDNSAQISRVYADLEEKNGWSIVPKGVHEMTITVEAENVDTILFWLVEMGTGTWGERTLIGYDIDGSDGWSIDWEFGDRIFHDYIAVQALGSDFSTQAGESLNVHSLDETDGE